MLQYPTLYQRARADSRQASLVLSWAQIDQRQVIGPGWILEVAGHDVRPDIYHLTISREPHTIINPGEIAHERV